MINAKERRILNLSLAYLCRVENQIVGTRRGFQPDYWKRRMSPNQKQLSDVGQHDKSKL